MAGAVTVQSEAYAQLQTALFNAQAFINGVTSVLININQPDIGQLPTPDYSATATLWNLLSIAPPHAIGGTVNVPLPVAPTLTFSPIDSVSVPDFTTSPPAIDIPVAPTISLPSVPAQPTIDNISLPSAPTLTLPTAPSLSTITIPTAPSLDIPTFVSTLPTVNFLAPTNTFSFAEQPYVDALLDADKAKLLADMVNGGYGIEPLDEANLWSRARDREIDATLMEIDEVYRFAGARGFPFPPGDIAVMAERAMQKQQEKLSSISREIAIKKADMFVDNRKFTITEVRALETVLINFHNSVQERALNAAKATLDAAIAIFETQAKLYNSRLDGYKAEAQVFEARIRAALAQVEIYKAQIEGAKVSAEVQKTLVDVYSAQLNAVNLIVQIFKTQTEAANVAASVQRVKIDAFQALIQAYAAQVQAQVAVQNAYESRVKGELAKAQVFQTQAQAYVSSVEGLKVRADIIIGKARAEWEQASAKIDVYKGQIAGADLNLRGQLGVVDANLKTFQGQTGQYIASTNALAEQLKLDEASIEAARSANATQANIAIEVARLRLSSAIATLAQQTNAAKINGDYWTNNVAALSGAVQALATIAG